MSQVDRRALGTSSVFVAVSFRPPPPPFPFFLFFSSCLSPLWEFANLQRNRVFFRPLRPRGWPLLSEPSLPSRPPHPRKGAGSGARPVPPGLIYSGRTTPLLAIRIQPGSSSHWAGAGALLPSERERVLGSRFRGSCETPGPSSPNAWPPRRLQLVALSFSGAPGCCSDVSEGKKNITSDLKHIFKLRVFVKPDLWGPLACPLFLPAPGTPLPKDTRSPRRPHSRRRPGGVSPPLSGCQSHAGRRPEP